MTVAGRKLDPRTARRRIAATAPREPRGLDDLVGSGWVVATAAAWLVGISVILAISPEPADPAAASALAEALGMLIALGMSITVLGLATRHRFGFAAAAGTGGALTIMSLACPVSGHHTFGAWWLGELAIVTGLTALGIAGYRRARSASE
ncbi:MAG: hypothetical protein KY437_10680 [Actinobacteria bacterium]|nr:hypothetical protein [Actinomycetota bacterium]